MRFAYTIAYVADVGKTIAFYEEAFGLKRGFVHAGEDYGEMETGLTKLAFAANHLAASNFPVAIRPNTPESSPAGVEIALITEDVAAAYAKALQAGASSLAAPKAMPWGQTVAFVRDLNGVVVELGSEMAGH